MGEPTQKAAVAEGWCAMRSDGTLCTSLVAVEENHIWYELNRLTGMSPETAKRAGWQAVPVTITMNVVADDAQKRAPSRRKAGG